MDDTPISSYTTNTKSLNSISFLEKVDMDRVKHILSMKNGELIDYYEMAIADEKEIDCKDMLIEINKIRKLCNQYIKNPDKEDIERIYNSKDGKRHYVKGIGIQQLPCFIRNYLAHKLYDHDIINSHPTIMKYLASKVSGLETSYLTEYINDRDKVLIKNNITKNDIIALINIDKYKKQPTTWLESFCDEIQTIKNVLLNTIKHNYIPNKDSKNPKSSVFSQILHKYETKILKLVLDEYSKDISVPMYDGFLSVRPIDIDKLNELTAKFGVKWKHKPIETCIDFVEVKDLSVKNYDFLKIKWEKEHSFIASQGIFIVNETKIRMNKASITDYAANWTCINTDNGKLEKFLPIWLSDVDRFCYSSMDFYPYNADLKNDPTPNNVYNTFIPFKRNKIDDYDEIPDIFQEYLDKAFLDEQKTEYLIKYLAHIIQHPEELPEVILILKGLEGAGKDSLIKLITALIGIMYVFSTEDTDPIFGQFNGSISGKLIVQLNEMEQKKFIPIQEGLKDYATREFNNINEKYNQPRIEKNRVREIAISNHYDPVLPTATDRRYIIMLLNDALVNDTVFWNKFYAWLKDDDEMDKLYTYLLNYKLFDWKPKDRLITNELRMAQFNNIQPYIKYLYLNVCKGTMDTDLYTNCDNGEIKILKKDLLMELYTYYKEVDYGYAKKKVSEFIEGTTGIIMKRCSKKGYYYLINTEKLENTLLNANGLKNFLEFFEESDHPF